LGLQSCGFDLRTLTGEARQMCDAAHAMLKAVGGGLVPPPILM